MPRLASSGDLARANYNTLMQTEAAKKIWSDQQLLMINALHMFSASYFAGGVKITEASRTQRRPASAARQGRCGRTEARAREPTLVAPKRPDCPPEQKQKVMNSINAYVAIGQSAPRRRPSPAVPAVIRLQLTLSAIRV